MSNPNSTVAALGLGARATAATMILAAICVAGPATAADGSFCGQPRGEPAALQEAIAKADGIKKIHETTDYLAFQDAKTEAVFTFTRPGVGPAHPAAVCRMPVKDGDVLRLEMVIECRGAIDACQRLESDFKLLNARMEAHIRNQAASEAK